MTEIPTPVDFAAGEEPPDLEPLLGQERNGVPFEARWLRLPEVLDGTHVVFPGLPQRLDR